MQSKRANNRTNNSSNRTVRNRGRPRRGAKKVGLEVAEIVNQSRLPKIVNRGPFPTDMIVRIKYYNRFVVQGAAPFLVTPELRLNSAYQPIVGGPTGTLSGFAGASGIYDSYRVESCAVRVGAANNENFSVSGCMLLRDTQPSTLITTYALAEQAYASGPSIHKFILGYSTGNSLYSGNFVKFNVGKITGNQLMYLADRDFASAVTTVPNQTVWGSFVLISDGAGQNLTNGAFVDIEVEMITRFFSVKVIM